MNRRMRLRLLIGGGLVLAFVFVLWDPSGVISTDLRDNLIAECLGALVTLLIVDLVFEASEEREQARAWREFRRSLLHTLDADLHALWSLMLPEPLARDDPVRRSPAEERVRRFTRELSTPELWASAPAGHAKAVRARVRDLGEDAERLLVLSENVTSFELRATLDALRRACRALDEAWEQTPRGELAGRFAREVAPQVDALVAPQGRQLA